MWSHPLQRLLERFLERSVALACGRHARRAGVAVAGLSCAGALMICFVLVAMPHWIASLDDANAASINGPATAALHRDT